MLRRRTTEVGLSLFVFDQSYESYIIRPSAVPLLVASTHFAASSIPPVVIPNPQHKPISNRIISR
jgi:hypothetical protein